MKRVVLLLIAVISLYGPLFAQVNHWTMPTTGYSSTENIVGTVYINGVLQASSDIEFAAFVNGEPRSVKRLSAPISTHPELYFAQPAIMFNAEETGQPVSFKIYDHSTGKEYDHCTITHNGNPISITTVMQTLGAYSNPVMFSFEAEQIFTKDISAYTTNGGWHLISSPIGDVAPENVTNMTSNTFDLYRFNQSAALEWENYKDANNYHFNLNSGRGYLYANSSTVQLKFTGFPESGDTKAIPVSYDDNAKLKGLNLIGNPFTESAYLVDAANNGTALAYAKMNELGNGFTIVSNGAPVPAMEGAIYQATATGNVYFTKTAPAKTNRTLNLTVHQGRNTVDNAIIRFGEGNILEKYSFRENSTKVYIPQNGKDFALINADNEGEIPVCFKAETNGTYTLDISCENVSMGYLHLIDNLTSNDVDLLVNPNYTFNAKTTDYANRFVLVFATGNANDDQFAFFSNGKLIINNEGVATLQVIDVNGRILSSESISGCCSKSIDAATGVYMLRLINGESTKTQKIFVR